MFNNILNRTHLLPYVIGITYEQFVKLLPAFSKHLRLAEQIKFIPQHTRIRNFGGGRKSKLSSDKEKLLFILLYYRLYPSFRLMEALTGLDHTRCQRWKEFLEPILNKSLNKELNLSPMTHKIKTKSIDQIIDICPQIVECIVDATERPILRPKNPKNETKYFSGKRKYHTVKNQIVVNPRNKRILHVSSTHEGRKHDKKIFEQTTDLWTRAPPGTEILVDGGYQGIEHLSPYIKAIRPFKKPIGGKLSQAQKHTNKALSSIRVRVEHPFAYMKNFNILKHRFRNRLDKVHTPFETIACIYNFRLNTS